MAWPGAAGQEATAGHEEPGTQGSNVGRGPSRVLMQKMRLRSDP